ncbi:MAG: signal recognition particle protein [Alphaproteobacteria bacterium]|nr:signal recognition particle protein [Alphaproteobacteria bacterium]
MFESLGDKLTGVLDKLRGKGALTEDDVNAAAREIRIALLEADVALPVVKEFIERVRERAVGQEVIKSVTPAQQVVKIVHDTIVETLGSETAELKFATPPCAFLMVGLQGSGKTTSTAKIARFLTDKQRKKVLMASLDVNRPAAQEQLRQLGEQTGVATLPVVKGQQPVDIAKRAMDTARKEGFDVVMLDTAGRLSIDEALMNEAAEVKKATNPVETILVTDAMTGQDAVNTARAFDEKVGISAIMLTRVDGDARGGAALSMRAVTGKPIKLMGVGEKWDAIEPFAPDRIAGRILGMGDVVSLVEKASETVDQEKALKLAQKFKKGQFDFNDMLTQLQQMKKMGGMGALMQMLPGMGKMAGQLEEHGVDDSMLKRQEAIILSMTKKEREKPDLLNASRKKRIAAGSGTSVQEINRLVKQQMQMQTVMKRMRKMGMGKMMGAMKGLMGDKDAALLGQSLDPDALARDMAGLKDEGPLGPNPFDDMGKGPKGLPPGLGGGLPGLGSTLTGGFPAKGSGRKKKKR